MRPRLPGSLSHQIPLHDNWPILNDQFSVVAIAKICPKTENRQKSEMDHLGKKNRAKWSEGDQEARGIFEFST